MLHVGTNGSYLLLKYGLLLSIAAVVDVMTNIQFIWYLNLLNQ